MYLNKVLKIIYLLSLVLGLLISLQSCSTNTVFEDNKPIANRKWQYTDKIKFKVDVTDHKHFYNLIFNLRHTGNYRYANIFVLIRQINPNKKQITNRAEFILAKPDGQWIGSGSGNIISYQGFFKKKIKFPQTGTYYFEIEQNMRENPLKEILDVGLTISNVSSPE